MPLTNLEKSDGEVLSAADVNKLLAVIAGKVGIGTDTPTETLEIVGNFKISGTVISVDVAANTIHRGSNGSDHGYIDQDVRTVATPDFDGANLDGAVVINESGADVDLRVESDTRTNALLVQGLDGFVGVNNPAPTKDLDVVGEIRASLGLLFGVDTAAANTLDDYEEGTWTGSLDPVGGSITTDALANELQYTKIGRLVTVSGLIFASAVASPSGGLLVSGLPFALADGPEFSERTAGAIHCANLAVAMSTPGVPGIRFSIGTSFVIAGQGATTSEEMASKIDAGTRIYFCITYITD